MNRRTFAAWFVGLGSTSGCLDAGGPAGTPDERTTESPDEGAGTDREETVDGDASLTDWERSTDCDGDQPDRMHDSVVSVAEVSDEAGNDAVPIRYADLTDEERSIADRVTEVGGYGTCDPGDAFHRFLDRVRDNAERRDESQRVFLERNGTYYRLYVEFSDVVLSY